MTEPTISVRGLSKRFRRIDPNRPHTFQEAIINRLRGLRPVDTFWALRDIDLAIQPGQMVGLIGRNGAGKSTLLRLIGGVGRAETGTITVNGRIGALLDLGAGFNGDLTGRENIFINGVICGLTRREVADRFADIVAFAELADFIDAPLRTYSSGMRMRLAFSVAVHINPDILLIDEVLAVGDLAFQNKCLDRIAQFRANNCTILLVSHDAALVKRLCDEVIWLKQGKIAAHGPHDVVVGQYVAEMSAETRRRTPSGQVTAVTETGAELQLNENRFGSLEMQITAVRLCHPDGSEAARIKPGDPLVIHINYDAPKPIAAPVFGVSISTIDNFICYDASSNASRLPMPTLQGQGLISLRLDRLDLVGGRYFLDVGVYEQNWEYAYDYHWHVYAFTVDSPPGQKGIITPPHSWHFDE